MEWIKCSTQSPPKDKPFLGCGLDQLRENIEIITMIYYEGGEDEEGFDMMEGFYALTLWGKYNREHDCKPTHWMPLPNPPQE
jgi:hypothetical protein